MCPPSEHSPPRVRDRRTWHDFCGVEVTAIAVLRSYSRGLCGYSPRSVLRAILARMKLRRLINAKCKDCAYDPHDVGNWRQQVEACTVTLCPLHPVRPVSRPRKGYIRVALRAHRP